MSRNTTRTIDEQLLAARLAITNTLADADVLAAMTRFGYDAAKIQAGQALFDEAQRLVHHQKAAYGQQYRATAEVKAARQAADRAYKRALKISRIAFAGNHQAQLALGLTGRRQQSLAGWLQQAATFYDNLLAQPELLAGMATFGYSQPQLESEQALVAAVSAATHRQAARKGAAQAATQRRDAQLAALEGWLADFKVVAHIALEDQAQRLEQLGFGPVA
jgi:hypothetical protein